MIQAYINRIKEGANIGYMVRGSIGTFAIKVISAILAIIAQAILARQLGVEFYGIYSFVFACTTFAVVIAKLGFDASSPRFLAVYLYEKKLSLANGFIRYSNQRVLLASLIVMIAYGIVLWLVHHQININLYKTFIVSVLVIPALAFLELQGGILTGMKRVIYAQIPASIIIPATLICVVFIVSSFININVPPEVAMAAYLISILAALSVSSRILFSVGSRARVDDKLYSEKNIWVKTSIRLGMFMCLNMLLFQIDTVMLGFLVEPDQVAYYVAATKLASLQVFLLMSINIVASPIFAELYAAKKMTELQKVFSLVTTATFMFAAFIGVILGLFGTEVLGFIFGKEYMLSYPVLLILVLGQSINAFVGPVGLIMNMTGHDDIVIKVVAGFAIINLILNAILIPIYGAFGAAVATASIVGGLNISFSILAMRRLGIVPVPLFFGKYTGQSVPNGQDKAI